MPKVSFQPMTDHIEAMIAGGYYRAGARIPSIRALCGQFKLSHGTVHRGLESLAQRNLVELRHGSGAYVRQAGPAVSRELWKIAVFSELIDPASYCGHILLGIRRQAESLNLWLDLNLLKYHETTGDRLDEAAEDHHALLLVGSYDGCLRSLPRRRPVVGIDMHYPFGSASLIGMDPVQNAELAAEFFRRRGIRKVVVIGHPLPLYRFRAEVFASYWQIHHGEAELVFEAEAYEDILRGGISAGRLRREHIADRSCGYFFVSGSMCNCMHHEYERETGRNLSDDFTLLSVDGKSLLVPDFYPVNTIMPDYCEIGSLALRECLRRIENPGSSPRRILVNGILYERNAKKTRRKPSPGQVPPAKSIGKKSMDA